MYKKSISLAISVFILGCVSKPKQTYSSNNVNENINNINIERIDCNYYWPARQVHVCIKNMLKEECEFLFSNYNFIKEIDCYCEVHQKPKNIVETSSYIQYDCK